MYTLVVVISRAGSKGLPDKCVRPLLGRPVIEYTFDHALAARLVDAVVLTTDSEPAKRLARARGIAVVDRPAELATDTATVDAAARHAVGVFEVQKGRQVDAVVLLYGNIPVRAEGVIDRAIEHLADTGADSVRTVAPATKQHPDWVHRLDGDRMAQFRENSIYRRQDLEPVYYHDGAVAAVTRAALLAAPRWEGDFQGFLGDDRRAIVQRPEDSVDIDGPVDLYLAEALLRARRGQHAEVSSNNGSPADVRVGRRVIGTGRSTYVIAEAGVCHNGSLETALQMVEAAASVGADAVKFQMFAADRLVTPSAAAAAYQQAHTGAATQYEMLRRLELTPQQFMIIRQRCQDRGIEFLATPFSEEDLRDLLELNVTAIKLASTDLNNIPLTKAAAEASLPLIVSTGAADTQEIEAAVERLTEWGAADRLVLLHCVSSYPTPWDEANLRAVGELSARFGRHGGFSDHTESETTGGLAAAVGARVIEKHFTLDRTADGPDHAMALEPEGLRRYIEGVRQAEAALGDGCLDYAPCEREVRQLARRSLVAIRDIAAGEVLTPACLAVKRPGGGIDPEQLERLVGRQAATSITAETQLSWEMVQ